MTNREKIFRKRLSDLVKWYDDEFKIPRKTAKDILRSLKNTIENSNCPTCDESDEYSDGEIIIQRKKKYPPKIWRCDACDVTMTLDNRLNHEKTNKHKKNSTCDENQ